MKTTSFQFVVLFLLPTLLPYTTAAQWVQTNGPIGPRYVSCLASSGANLFAGGREDGVFFSSDNGTNWSTINTGLTNTSIRALAASSSGGGDTNVFAGTLGGVFLSTNNGTNWTAVNSGLTSTVIYSLAVVPGGAGGAKVFAGTRDGGVFRSTDNGTSWLSVNNGLTISYVHALAVSPNGAGGTNLYAGVYGVGVFLSTNDGDNWTEIRTSPTYPNPYVWTIVASPNGSGGTNLFAGTESGLFLHNGNIWTNVLNYYVPAVAVSGANISAARYGTSPLFSYSNGNGWIGVHAAPGISLDIRAFVHSGTNLFAGTNGGGVIRSWNNGISWGPSGLSSSSVTCFIERGANLFVGTSITGVLRSTNSGANWTSVFGGGALSFAASDTNLFVGTGGAGVYRSTNDGASWTTVSAGLTNAWVSSLAMNGTSLFAGTLGGIFRSANNGTNWTPINAILGYVTALVAKSDGIGGGKLFAGEYATSVFLSTNNGETWINTRTSYTYPNPYVYTLAVGDTDVFAGTERGVFRYDGTTWTGTGLMSIRIQALAVTGSTLFAGTSSGGAFCSTNNGINWTAVNTGLPSLDVRALALHGTRLFAGIGTNGVWSRPLSEMITSVEQTSTNLTERYALYQNYPNPFNPSTTIGFSIPVAGYVALQVFNILGQVVATVLSQELAAGTYEAKWDVIGFASGTYFYRLTAGTFVGTRRLVVLR